MVDGTVYMFATVYFWAGAKNWIYFALIGQLFAIISALVSFYLPESPKFLFATKQYTSLNLIIHKMAKFNGINLKIDPNYLESDEKT